MAKLIKHSKSLEEVLDSTESLWVQSRVQHDIIISYKDRSNPTVAQLLCIPKIFPVNLSEQTSRENLRGVSDLARFVGTQILMLIDPGSVQDRISESSRERVREMLGTSVGLLDESKVLGMEKNETEEIDMRVADTISAVNALFDDTLSDEDRSKVPMSAKQAELKLTEIQLSSNEATIDYVRSKISDKASAMLKKAWGE